MRDFKNIKYRAKGINKADGWVTGCYYYVDDNTNNPFQCKPSLVTHYIVHYWSGDWNMGCWNHIEVLPKTIQQYTGLKDKNGREIYEGEILRIYYSISYDDDGTCTIGSEYKDAVVKFEKGAFKLDSGELLFNIEPWFNLIEVVGNALELTNNEIANAYRQCLLIENFEKNHQDNWPELIDVAYIAFAHEAAKINMDDYICQYNSVIEALTIEFTQNGNKFIIIAGNLDNELGYTLQTVNEKEFVNRFINLKSSTNFNDIIEYFNK